MGVKLIVGVNDLKTIAPEIASQADGWDPMTLTAGSGKKMAWKCGKGHQWQSVIHSRVKGSGCPYCMGKKPIKGETDLQSRYPEIASEAHGWDPAEVMPGSHQRLSWICSKGHRWEQSPNSRTNNDSGCPYCCGRKVFAGYNDLAHLRPDLAKEASGWDPEIVTLGSNMKKWWICGLGHKYRATPVSRTVNGSGCPYCSGKSVLKGFNDLLTKAPEIASEADGWDPSGVLWSSHSQLNWIGRCGHKWKTEVRSRTKVGTGCPICTNKTVGVGVNDLATTHPLLASESDGWDPTTVVAGSPQKKTWVGKCGHRWIAAVHSRAAGRGCPYCSGVRVLSGFNDLATKYPQVAAEAHGWDPSQVMPGDTKRRRWKCSTCQKDWDAKPNNRTSSLSGCPSCAEYGYSFAEPAWMYLMCSYGQQQFGITNSPKRRIPYHKRFGWSEMELIGPFDGKKVFELERDVKRWLASQVGTVEGTTENWKTVDLEVETLAELCEKAHLSEKYRLLSEH